MLVTSDMTSEATGADMVLITTMLPTIEMPKPRKKQTTERIARGFSSGRGQAMVMQNPTTITSIAIMIATPKNIRTLPNQKGAGDTPDALAANPISIDTTIKLATVAIE